MSQTAVDEQIHPCHIKLFEFLHGVVASFEAPHCLFQTDQSILIQIKIGEVFHRTELNQITSVKSTVWAVFLILDYILANRGLSRNITELSREQRV